MKRSSITLAAVAAALAGTALGAYAYGSRGCLFCGGRAAAVDPAQVARALTSAPASAPVASAAPASAPGASAGTFAAPPPEPDPAPAGGGYAVLAHNSILRAGPSPAARLVRNVGVGIVRVTFTERVERDGAAWLRVNEGEWVREDLATVLAPSPFRGVEVRAVPRNAFGWVTAPAARRATPGGAVQGAPLARYDFVQVLQTAPGPDGRAWNRLADGWVPADSVAVVDADARPDGVRADDRWVEIDLAEQTVAAYEGDRMVYATLVSSGLDQKTWATRTGLFSVQRRVQRGRMQGDAGTPDYYSVEDVPNALYFDGATALHGAYWHDAFGGKKSHGCVNLAPGDAAWTFRWSAGGPRPLRVWVHASPPAAA
jgi:hypothetical protein